MKPSILLRAASVVAMLFGVGHSFGAPWTPALGPSELVVIDAMKSHQFVVMGDMRSFWDFYVGFGWSIAVFLVAQAIVLWQLAAQSKVDPPDCRRVPRVHAGDRRHCVELHSCAPSFVLRGARGAARTGCMGMRTRRQ
jgi:hypothetical protein